MAATPDLASLYALLAQQQRPVLPSGERRAIIGCGYVGSAVAQTWKQQGHHLIGTTASPERLGELETLVDQPQLFEVGTSRNDLSFLEDLDGLLLSFAPSKSSYVDLDQYRNTFLGGLATIVEALDQRRRTAPLQVVHLSSCGVYGNRGGALTDEDAPLDRRHPVNDVLARAEELIASVRSDQIQVCVLRLGGIYGPGRDIPAMLRSAAGQVVQRNGANIPCWIHRDDIERGVSFAFDRGLDGTYNLVNDTQLCGQDLTDQLCEKAGLPMARWLSVETSDRVLHARVSNARLKEMGFSFAQPSFVD